jgi:hypothetical protein
MSDIYDTESNVFDPVIVKFPVELVDAVFCTWAQGYNLSGNFYFYLTACKEYHSFRFDKLPFIAHRFQFCPYCGKPINDVPYDSQQ